MTDRQDISFEIFDSGVNVLDCDKPGLDGSQLTFSMSFDQTDIKKLANQLNSAYKLSKDIGIPQTRTSAILKGVRGITADTALRLSLYFGTSPKFWLGLQDDFDLEEALKNKQTELNKIKKIGDYAAQ